MQHVGAFGYPTPPGTPTYEQQCAAQLQHIAAAQQPCQQRFVPVAAEERLGRFLTPSLKLDGILGTGAYGVVYSAVDLQDNARYAVKCLSKFNADGTPLDRRQHFFQTREIRLHHLASAHRNVVSMHKIIDNPDCVYVILECCPEGDLFQNITERGQYVGKDELAKSVFLQILDAVEHCHSLGIYHRDLKPENILVKDNGATVKLADFGLATADDRSDDYGCGSTFYMSPECLDQTTRRPFYFCAPNDVWSLGVILVNLTCGRNPWKQASFEDSTYRAFATTQGFLKTILPVSDELNDILGRIFTRNPDQRITLHELRARILHCPRFTEQSAMMMPTPPASPECSTVYVNYDESAIDDDEYDYDEPLSPLSDSMSDGESTCSSDEGSLTSSVSSIEDDFEDDDEFPGDIPEAKTPPPQPLRQEPAIYEAEDASVMRFRQEYLHPFACPPAQEPLHPMALPFQPACGPKFVPEPFDWDRMKFAPSAPPLYQPVPFHHQVPALFIPHMQGCY